MFKGYREWDFNVLPEDYKTSVFITLDTEYLNVNFLVSGEEDVPLPTAQIRKENSIEETEDAFNESSPSELLDIQETSEDITRLPNAKGVNLGMHHVMLEIGPSRLMVGDLWTLLPPHVAVQHSSETNSMKDFVGGWLVDKVVCS